MINSKILDIISLTINAMANETPPIIPFILVDTV